MTVDVMSDFLQCHRKFLERRAAVPAGDAGPADRRDAGSHGAGRADRGRFRGPEASGSIGFAPWEKTRSGAWPRVSPRATRRSAVRGRRDGTMRFPYIALPTRRPAYPLAPSLGPPSSFGGGSDPRAFRGRDPSARDPGLRVR